MMGEYTINRCNAICKYVKISKGTITPNGYNLNHYDNDKLQTQWDSVKINLTSICVK